MATHSSILPGKFPGQRSLVGYSLWGRKESDTTKHVSLSQNSEYNSLCYCFPWGIYSGVELLGPMSAEKLMFLNCGVGEDSRVPWTARRSSQSILEEMSPGC